MSLLLELFSFIPPVVSWSQELDSGSLTLQVYGLTKRLSWGLSRLFSLEIQGRHCKIIPEEVGMCASAEKGSFWQIHSFQQNGKFRASLLLAEMLLNAVCLRRQCSSAQHLKKMRRKKKSQPNPKKQKRNVDRSFIVCRAKSTVVNQQDKVTSHLSVWSSPSLLMNKITRSVGLFPPLFVRSPFATLW